ncbi:MAG: OmpA family protein [Myxococcales bacterium]|nr:OmpA family protein [Myxococcales bacterium]MCB9539831.1 OmpA family protein [Myxococcales bacterium]
MSRVRHVIGLLAAATVLALPSLAAAQDAQLFKPASGSYNYFTVDGARVPKHTEFIPALTLSYGHNPLVIRDTDDEVKESIVGGLGTANLTLSVGFVERLELAVDVPLHFVSGDRVEATGDDGVKLGDVRFMPKVRLFGLEDGYGVGAAIVVPVAFPTGTKESFVGEDQIIANPKLAIEARVPGFSFAANGGVRFRPEDRGVGTLDVRHEVTYGAGVGVDLGTEDVVLIAEGFGAAAISDVESGSASNPLEALMGVRLWAGPGPVITLGGGFGIVPDYGSPEWRAIFGFAWHDRNYDRDLDGILDSDDQCPDDPEDKDTFEDADGCPDPDNDQDGVLDTVDNCPMDAEDKDGFQDADGCPDPDNDGDTILDVDDSCPMDPEVMNGFKDDDGCPDEVPDTDGDGLKDPDDRCPTDPEDIDQFEDEDGCPDPDNDKDGILDVNDGCPLQPETVNEFEDTDGCPDEKPAGPVLVRITREKIEILQKVFFATNKAVILRKSYPVLDQVADVMKRHPYIKKVRVEGHTDSRGSDRYNKKLSQLRADSVKKYLIGQGVEPERLESVGYGEEQPIDDNRTSDGRANNRRVEFTITEQ